MGGNSDLFDCDNDDYPFTYEFKVNKARKWSERFAALEGKFHHTGVVMPLFMSKWPKPKFAWHHPTHAAAGNNPALRGIMYLDGVTFANFDNRCNGLRDLVIRSNPKHDDVNWPIKMKNIKLLQVEETSKVFINRPLLGKINPGDCTDFDCDGMKKIIVWDTDGSFSGSPGSIIPDSAYEWDGNPKRGLGYYRVPKPMVTELNGDKIENADKMPNTGIYRGDNKCSWNTDWQAYKCTDINHRLMIIESMDRDTKVRRLSPIAVLADAGTNGYIDLVNGPQDFSCCSGYTCAERLSTFFTMVATGLEYEVMFTSIPPQNFRIHFLYNDGGDAIRAKIWFPKQQRYDIYVNGQFMEPNNKDFNSADYKLLPPDDSFIPALTETQGANYFDPNTGHLYLIVKGPSNIDIKTQPIVVLKMGITVPIENFFEENVVGNLAGLLGIDPSNIRVTNIVREGSVPGRKKRAADDGLGDIVGLEFAVGPPPSDTLHSFYPEAEPTTPDTSGTTINPAYTTVTQPGNTTTEFELPASHLDYDALVSIQGVVANAFQTGTLDLGIDGSNMTATSMEAPLVPPEAPPEYTSPEERAQVLELTWAEQVALNNSEQLQEYALKSFDVPEELGIAFQPEDVAEMQTIPKAFKIYAKDSKGKQVSELGDPTDPWQCTVTVQAGPGGSVMGTTTVSFMDGIATFDDIHIDQSGTGYILQFEISYPTTSIVGVMSDAFDVAGRPLGLKFTSESALIPQNSTFSVTATIWDDALDQAAETSVLTSLSWDCTIALTNGTVTGTTEVPVATGDNTVTFDDLMIAETGLAYDLSISCVSDDGITILDAVGAPFHVHDYPTSGLLQTTTTTFTFSGTYEKVKDILDKFPGSFDCTGCPSTGADQLYIIPLDPVFSPLT